MSDIKKFIVTTTINPPTEALIKYAKKDWLMIVVGDIKSPHDEYRKFCKKYPNVTYLKPEKQDRLYHGLSESIGWNCIQRRGIGIAEAYNKGAEIVALVDDDNIPYDEWGKDLLIGKNISVDYFVTEEAVFDPLSVTAVPYFWHRGFPVQMLGNRHKHTMERKEVHVEVQADLWDGAPDIDAICRIIHPEDVEEYDVTNPYSSNALCPFNSQNTFLSREAIKHYFLFPHIGRMDDIWAAYVLQDYMPNCVVYNKPSVFQKRNVHNVIKDMQAEMYGYEFTESLVKDLFYWTNYLPQKSLVFVKEYLKAINGNI